MFRGRDETYRGGVRFSGKEYDLYRKKGCDFFGVGRRTGGSAGSGQDGWE